jgi:CheY-like chemotaxis protein
MTTPQNGGSGAAGGGEGRGAQAPLILVADQDDATREWCVAVLAGAGFRVTRARTGFEAIVKACCREPDVMLVRQALPGFEGWGAVELLALCPSTCHIPIVGLAAETPGPGGAAARLAGCAGLLQVPVPPRALLETIEGALKASLYASARPFPGTDGLQPAES